MTKHTVDSGPMLKLEHGAFFATTRFEQESAVDPVTARPVTTGTALSIQLLAVDPDSGQTLADVRLVPEATGKGIWLQIDGQHVQLIEWSKP